MNTNPPTGHRDRRARRRHPAIPVQPVVALVLLVTLLATGCADPDEPVADESTVECPDPTHLNVLRGQQLTVTARVGEVIGPRAFRIFGEERDASLKEGLLVIETGANQTDVEDNQDVRVTGTVGVLDLGRVEQEHEIDVAREALDAAHGEDVIFAETVTVAR